MSQPRWLPWVLGAAAAGGLWWALAPRPPALLGASRIRWLSRFGLRRGHMHAGIDLGAPKGTPVRAVRSGTVVDLAPDGRRKGYGNTVYIRHDDGTASLYAHLDRWAPSLRRGQRVEQGQTIGAVGTTEKGHRHEATQTKPMAPHLHLEIHRRVASRRGSGPPPVTPTVPERLEPLAYLRWHRVPLSEGVA